MRAIRDAVARPAVVPLLLGGVLVACTGSSTDVGGTTSTSSTAIPTTSVAFLDEGRSRDASDLANDTIVAGFRFRMESKVEGRSDLGFVATGWSRGAREVHEETGRQLPPEVAGDPARPLEVVLGSVVCLGGDRVVGAPLAVGYDGPDPAWLCYRLTYPGAALGAAAAGLPGRSSGALGVLHAISRSSAARATPVPAGARSVDLDLVTGDLLLGDDLDEDEADLLARARDGSLDPSDPVAVRLDLDEDGELVGIVVRTGSAPLLGSDGASPGPDVVLRLDLWDHGAADEVPHPDVRTPRETVDLTSYLLGAADALRADLGAAPPSDPTG